MWLVSNPGLGESKLGQWYVCRLRKLLTLKWTCLRALWTPNIAFRFLRGAITRTESPSRTNRFGTRLRAWEANRTGIASTIVCNSIILSTTVSVHANNGLPHPSSARMHPHANTSTLLDHGKPAHVLSYTSPQRTQDSPRDTSGARYAFVPIMDI